MILCVVGSRELSTRQRENVVWLIDKVVSAYDLAATKFISGGASGVDTIFEERVMSVGGSFTRYEPGQRRWHGPDGFRARNIRMVEDCDELICIQNFLAHPRLNTPHTEMTYGSGWTYEYAVDSGVVARRYWV